MINTKNYRRCKKCDEVKLETTEYFNKLPSGNFRGTCKRCMAVNTKWHYDNNPQAVIDRVAKYKEQKELNGGYCTNSDLLTIRRQQNDICLYCGIELNGCGELDHKIPVSRGGDTWPSNMAWSCTTCNRDKHNKTGESGIFGRRYCCRGKLSARTPG